MLAGRLFSVLSAFSALLLATCSAGDAETTVAVSADAALLSEGASAFRALPQAPEFLELVQKIPAAPRAYAMYFRGGRTWMRLAGVAIVAIRAFDPTTPIVLLGVEEVDADVAHMLRFDMSVHIITLPPPLAEAADKQFGQRCGIVPSCWLKFVIWALVPYKVVMYVDIDVLAVRPLTGAFEIFEKRLAPTPFDIAGVPDVVAALRFRQTDCFNTGLFLLAPSLTVFSAFWDYAAALPAHQSRTGQWPGSDTWPLITWPTMRGGQWVRLPLTYNVYPHVFHSVTEAYAHFDGPIESLRSVHALHFVYPSKALFARPDCKVAAGELRGACRVCCEAFHAIAQAAHNRTAAAASKLGVPFQDDGVHRSPNIANARVQDEKPAE